MAQPRGRGGSVAGVWRPGEGVPARPGALAGWTVQPYQDQLRGWLRIEAGPGRLFPWIPVAFGAGIACYFAADREPVLSITIAAAALLVIGAGLMRRHRLYAAIVLIAATASGFAVATLRTAIVAHGVLARPMFGVSIAGFVETRDIRERTDRFVLRVVRIDSPRGSIKLERVRLSVRKGAAPDVGSFVELKARLQPPLPPQRPGSYDFSRDMYFQGIGASGFVTGAIQIVQPPADGGLMLRYAAFMQGLRDGIDDRIRGTLDGDRRAIATALLTGRRDAITPSVNDAMFISGLGHVLSISGYHMAVVAGVVFFTVRALLALIPGLALRVALKKWAAAAALLAATFYLLLSGAEVATQRSFFMTAVVLIAVIVDRRAVTFRTLAVAAMVVLILAPESLVHPSFQMSFAATLGLVALVQIGMPRLFASPDHSRTARLALWGGRELVTLTLASLVAGLATTPYAAFHFHRVTPYGVLANLAAMPVVSALVMPAGLLGLVAAPFGLDSLFWWLMGIGIDWMILVTQWVAALPGAIGRMASFGTGPLILSSIAIVLLGLLRSPLRWSGAGLLISAILWALVVPQPEVLISGDGHNVAVRGSDDRLHFMRSTKDAFLLKEWLAADADDRPPTDTALTNGVSCDEAGCVSPLADGRLVALAFRPEALVDDCSHAVLIIATSKPPPDCPAEFIDRDDLKARGTMALHRKGARWTISAIKPAGTERPWSPTSSNDGLAAKSSVPAGERRAIDATPPDKDVSSED